MTNRQLQTVLDALQEHARYAGPKTVEAIAIVQQMMQAKPGAYLDKYGELFKDVETVLTTDTPIYTHPAPQAMPAVCEWTQDADFEMGDTYHSSCGELWSFIDGGPKENRVSYCHHCGKHVKLASAQKGVV
jgi:hypothetical protein